MTSSLVLRGTGASARLEGDTDHVRWEGGGRTLLIPLMAIAEVRCSDRTAEVVLTAAPGDSPAVYAVRDASEAAVAAFHDAVRARLPERPPHEAPGNGAELVTVVSERRSWWRSVRTRIIAVVAVAAIDVTALLLGEGDLRFVLPFVQLIGVGGGVIAFWMGRALYYGWWLPRHGITVLADFAYSTTQNAAMYRYTDLDGVSRLYRSTSSELQVEVSYDPRDPGRASGRLGVYQWFLASLLGLFGLAPAVGGLALTAYQLLIL